MTIIDTLVTDRTQADVTRLNELYAEGMEYWTANDLYYFLHGDPENLEATDGDLIDSLDDDIIIGEGVIRGAYNEWDMNRVGKAVRFLADMYYRTTATELSVTARYDWHWDTIPTVGLMTAYLNDIKTLRTAIGAYSDTPSVPSSASKMTYKSANNIEKILIDLNRRLEITVESWRYAGEVIAGEV